MLDLLEWSKCKTDWSSGKQSSKSRNCTDPNKFSSNFGLKGNRRPPLALFLLHWIFLVMEWVGLLLQVFLPPDSPFPLPGAGAEAEAMSCFFYRWSSQELFFPIWVTSASASTDMVSVGWAQGWLWGTQGCGVGLSPLGSPQPHGTLQLWGRGAGKGPRGAGDSPDVPRCPQRGWWPWAVPQMTFWKLAISNPLFKLLNAFSSVKAGLI